VSLGHARVTHDHRLYFGGVDIDTSPDDQFLAATGQEYTALRVNVAEIAGGRFAIAEFTGTAHEIESAWDQIFCTWLPQSGLQPDDRPCLEVYRGRSADEKTGIFRCELCLPVKTL